MPPKAIVLSGDGFNTEEETIFVLSRVGFAASTMHISDLLSNSNYLNNMDLLVIPGGSYQVVFLLAMK